MSPCPAESRVTAGATRNSGSKPGRAGCLSWNAAGPFVDLSVQISMIVTCCRNKTRKLLQVEFLASWAPREESLTHIDPCKNILQPKGTNCTTTFMTFGNKCSQSSLVFLPPPNNLKVSLLFWWQDPARQTLRPSLRRSRRFSARSIHVAPKMDS